MNEVELWKAIDAAVREDMRKRGCQNGRRDVYGEIDCPKCGMGKIRYSWSAYNGHVHGKCSTACCLYWME